jgi:hypothetical protein
MAMMISEVFEAFQAAGVPNDKARAAAEAISSETIATKGDISRLEKEFEIVKGELKLIKWMLALVIVVTVMPFLKALLG